MPNFLDAFTPSRGDLVYGRTDAREEYFKRVPQGTRTIMGFAWYQIDSFNNWFGTSELQGYAGVNADYLKQRRAKGDDELKQERAGNIEPLKNAQKMRARFQDKPSWDKINQQFVVEPETKSTRHAFAERYSDSLQRSRFSPDAVPLMDPMKVMKNVDVLESAEARAYAGLYTALRRGCKFGLGMVATETIYKDAKVHFILDNIDMITVCGKRAEPVLKVQIENKIKTEPGTCAELRYAYRNWGALKGKVLFYVNLEQVEAPWDEDWSKFDILGKPILAKKADWAGYQLHREDKYRAVGGIPTKSLT